MTHICFNVFFSGLFDGFIIQVLGVLEFTQKFLVIMVTNVRYIVIVMGRHVCNGNFS